MSRASFFLEDDDNRFRLATVFDWFSPASPAQKESGGKKTMKGGK
jgi:hypothetical protein